MNRFKKEIRKHGIKLESDYPGIYKGEIEQIQQELNRMTEKELLQ